MAPVSHLFAISGLLASPVSLTAQVVTQPNMAPQSAMAFLVKTLPGLKKVDTWEGGWFEAKLDGAGTDGHCRLTMDAPFGLIHRDDGTSEVHRSHWHLDFSTVTGVGQKGNRMIFKMRKVDQVVGYDAGTPELALSLAYAFDTLRQACVSVPPPDNLDTPDN